MKIIYLGRALLQSSSSERLLRELELSKTFHLALHLLGFTISSAAMALETHLKWAFHLSFCQVAKIVLSLWHFPSATISSCVARRYRLEFSVVLGLSSFFVNASANEKSDLPTCIRAGAIIVEDCLFAQEAYIL